MKRAPGRIGDRRGQALAEMAIVLPVLLLLVFGIIELSNAWRSFQVVTNSAREGARVIILPTAQEDGVVERIARSMESGRMPLADQESEPGDQVIFECVEADSGQPVAGGCFGTSRSGAEAVVRIEYPYTFSLLGPIVQYACGGACAGGFGTITLASTSTMRIE
jgi:hypothetical protein